MFKLSELFGQRGGSYAFGRRAVKNIGIRTDIGQTFAETGTTSPVLTYSKQLLKCPVEAHKYENKIRSLTTILT